MLTQDRLDELVPIEPARMEDRAIIEWDKDDIDALKFMKVDVLSLGMLGCMRRAFALLADAKDTHLDLATIPAEDPRTYAMIRKADTLGTFRIASRAQMAMLPRLKPRTFYDLVVQVAIVRPGPTEARVGQGGDVTTIEDETGVANLVIWPTLFAKQRRMILSAGMIEVDGRVQREGETVHVVA